MLGGDAMTAPGFEPHLCSWCEELIAEGGGTEHAECRETREANAQEKHDVEQWEKRRDLIPPRFGWARSQEDLDDDANDAIEKAKERRLGGR